MVVAPRRAEYKNRVNQPQSPFPPDSARPAGSHRGPPVDLRPRSTLGIWALFLSVVLALTSAMVGFVWILLLPAVLLALYGVWKIRPDVAKGQGMALIALVVALVAASGSYLGAKVFREMSTVNARGVLAGLAGTEDRRLNDWLDEEAKQDGLAETLRQRFDVVVQSVGSYQREIVEAPLLAGARGVLTPPPLGSVEEIGGDGKDPPRALEQNVLWARARFEKAVLFVELTFGQDEKRFATAFQDLQSKKPLGALSDVRFWREVTP